MYKSLIIFSLVTGSLLLSGCEENRDTEQFETVDTYSNTEVNVSPQLTEKEKETPLVETTDIVQNANKKPDNIVFSLQGDTELLTPGTHAQRLPDVYSEIEGVLTFRGDNLRNSPSFGLINSTPSTLEKVWEFQTGSSLDWGGGAGWTGQPAIIKWEPEVRKIMNLKEELKNKENFTEVIYASLDGHVYFLDLETGKESRPSIDVQNPIKGSISIDPRGYPILYVGQGIPETGESNIGFRIFSLIDGKMLHFIKGVDGYAYRGWGAFDGAPLINRFTDTMYLAGENGVFYSTKLNTMFDLVNSKVSINPQTIKYKYKITGSTHQGIENSVAAYKNMLYFTDNGGTLQGLDLIKMEPSWALGKTDDSDATIAIGEEEGIPFLYTGTEVDKQGTKGNSILRKIDGFNGKEIWKKEIPALSQLGDHPVNGGLLASPILGEKDISNLVIYTISRYKTMAAGLMIALDRKTGKELWRWEMSHYAWSSPVSVYDENGTSYLLQCDSIGNIHLIKGITGEVLRTVNFHGTNIEASPAIFNDRLVVANRGGQIFSLKIK